LYYRTRNQVASTKNVVVGTEVPVMAGERPTRDRKAAATHQLRKGMRMLNLSKAVGPLVAGVLLLAGATAKAETFPAKPVHILVPYAAGGAVDVLARTLAQSLAKTWGQQPVIDNRPGAGGLASARAVVAGRLHADPGRQRPSAQPVHLSEPAL
jgi:Tripartite tricarboxylate transporter family receptor